MTWQLKVHPLACIAVGALTGVAVIFAVVHLYDGHDFINSANDLTSRPTPSSRRRRLRISNERQHNTTPSSYSAPDEARRRRHQRRVEILIEEPEERIDDSAWQEDEQWEEEDSHTEAQERAEAQEEDAEEDEEEEEEEEEEEALPVSLFKEWSEDNNKNLLHLLHAISDSQSRKEGFIHRGITCNKCNMSPVRGIRFKCANCIDFDLCEMCEGSNTHTNTHVFLKLRIPIPPLANPRSALLPSFYPGKATSRSTLSHDKIRELQSRSHFDKVELEALYEQFKSLATVEKTELGIDFETFERCLGPLGLEKNLITERIYAFFDQDKDGTINFGEMVSGFSVLCKGNFDEKIEYAFKGYDMDEDGYISREELYRMFKAYFYLSMELVRDVVSAMEDEMMDTFEFSPSAPVSSAFNVSIPTPASDHENEHATDPSTSHANRSAQRYPAKDLFFEEQYAKEDSGMEYLKNASSSSSLERVPMMRQWKQKSTLSKKKTWEEKFPIMDTMSQDAIHEMVKKTFKSIDTVREGYISFEEFKRCVQADSSIVSWFEALGTVF